MLVKVTSYLTACQFKEGLKETEEKYLIAVEKMRQGKKKFERKKEM